jgi:hypothetical protein
MSNMNDSATPTRYRPFGALRHLGARMFPLRVAVPTRYPPAATWALIAANCAVLFVQLNFSPAELQESGMDRRTIVAFSGSASAPLTRDAPQEPFRVMSVRATGGLTRQVTCWALPCHADCAISDRA